MLRNEYLTCMSLHKILKEGIKGKIFIVINEGVLTIYINAGRDIKYEKNINITSGKIDIEELANKIKTDYKEFINYKFFI